MKRLASGLMLTLLLTSMLAVIFRVQPAKGEWTGTVYIRADGRIDPPDAPIISYDNITYTLFDNITSSADGIVVEKDNIIIDGNGFTLQGSEAWGSKGINISGRYNVTINNTNIQNFKIGIYLYESSNNTIIGNSIANNDEGIYLGYSCSHNSIIGNSIANNDEGIYLGGCSKNSINGNMFAGSGLFVWDPYGNTVENVVENNTVNGKPLVYLEGVSSCSVSDSGQVILVRSTGIMVEGLNLSGTNVGVLLWRTSDTKIIGNSIANNGEGISLYHSFNNSINGNNITSNGDGIFFRESFNNSISGNSIANNTNGISLVFSSDNNSISGNNVTNNLWGIQLFYSFNNRISGNNFINNDYQARAYGHTNVWDDGYPSGGNYWSDYVERYPDAEEFDGSGLWDTPYVIDENNTDRYPLMYPYGTETYKLTITTTTSGGTTNPSPGTHTYANGTIAEVTAVPNTGFSFGYWLFDGEKRTENPTTVIMDSNHTLAAYFVDDIPPEISEPWQDPPANNVQPLQNVTVYVNVTDYGTGIKNVTLWYSIDNGTTWTILNMTELPIPSDTWITYEAIIDGYGNCTWVTYKIVAYDNAGNNATKDNNGYGYQYHVIPEYPSALILVMLMLTTLIAAIPLKKRRTKNNFLDLEGLI